MSITCGKRKLKGAYRRRRTRSWKRGEGVTGVAAETHRCRATHGARRLEWLVLCLWGDVWVFFAKAIGLWGVLMVRVGSDKMGHGRTHASSLALSSSVRGSFILSLGRRDSLVEPTPSVLLPKSSSRRRVDCFVAPFFFVAGLFLRPPSRGPRCLLRAPGMRLWKVCQLVGERWGKRANVESSVA